MIEPHMALLPPPVASSPRRLQLRTSFGPAWVVESAREIDPALRQRAFAHHCKDFRYYELIEETLPTQFKYRYLGLENSATGEVTVQPFFYVEQDLLAGLPERFRLAAAKLRRVWPRLLTLRILMVGCASAEGQLSSAAPWVADAL